MTGGNDRALLGALPAALVAWSMALGCGAGDGSGLDAGLPRDTDAAATDAAATDASGVEDADRPPGGERAPNVLLLIADDMGVDSHGLFGDQDGDGVPDDGRPYASTPRIDDICSGGVRFTTAWATPICSPTRATLLTGRYGFRTGIGTAVERGSGIDPSEPSLARIFDDGGYRTANLGKWHLGTTELLGNRDAPATMGWSYFSGLLSGGLMDYFSWTRVEDGVRLPETRYATTANVDDAVAWVTSEPSEAPWLVWIGFNAPHLPLHRPPSDLHEQELDGLDPETSPGPFYRAAIEALDAEIGRLIDGISTHNGRETIIVFMGDNGTPANAVEPPWPRSRSKNTLYEGGVHVPLCVRGPGISSGLVSDSLVHSVDLFGTLIELAGLEPPPELLGDGPSDSRSFAALLSGRAERHRDTLYTERFGTGDDGDGRAARDERFKLIVYASGTEALFHLPDDPYERSNLLDGAPLEPDAQDALDRLRAALTELSP